MKEHDVFFTGMQAGYLARGACAVVMVIDLRAEDRLYIVSDASEAEGVRIVCSLGMV